MFGKMFCFSIAIIFSVHSLPVYELKNLTKTSNGLKGKVEIIEGYGPYGNDIKSLGLEVYYETKNRLHVKLIDLNKKRWEVYPWLIKDKTPSTSPLDLNYDISFNSKPFRFIITRKEDQEVVFNSSQLIYSNQYLSIRNTLTSKTPNLYGFSDRVSSFKLDTDHQTYTLFNFGRYAYGNQNIYSSHPFYMEYKKSKANGVFLFNSNAMDVYINEDLMEYRTIGGIFDFYFFMGSKPIDVIEQYHTLIGLPHFPPRWSLGWHQCRWGYHNVTEVFDVVKGYEKYGIPLDAMWTDIDYMDAYKDFTVDPVNFPMDKMQEMVKYIHKANKHYVLIADPGIKTLKGYDAYDKLLESKAYIKTSDGVTPIVNKVWPGDCIFPDFSDPLAHEYWYEMLLDFHKKLPIDGLWIDMNELDCFCSGSCGSGSTQKKASSLSTNFDPINPPYLPGQNPLDTATLRMDAVHYGGDLEYDVHNLYGLMESNASSKAFEKIRNKRSFVLSRSTWAGSGHVASHWTGDNNANYMDLALSIPNLLKTQMSGVVHSGADVCGFAGNTNKELCERWTQLAVFYPFSRNHNNGPDKPQEPWALGMQEFAKRQISIRYSLIPFYYTIFFRIHSQGGVLWKAIWMLFPEEMQSSGIDTQFIVGDTLLVAPVLEISENDKFSYNVYFPNSRWYDFYSMKRLDGEGSWKEIEVDLDDIPVFIKGGKVLVKQTPSTNTIDQELNNYQFIIALDDSGTSSGELYLDDGDTLNTVENKEFTLLQFEASSSSDKKGEFTSKIVGKMGYKKGCEGVEVNEIFILGMEEKIKKVEVNGNIVQFVFEKGNLFLRNLQKVFLCDPISVKYY